MEFRFAGKFQELMRVLELMAEAEKKAYNERRGER